MITPIVNGESGLSVRAKLNVLIGDAIKKGGTDPGQFMSGNFVLDPLQPTRFFTDDGTIKNGLLWYGTAGTSFLSEKSNQYAAFIVDQAAEAQMQVMNYSTNTSASLKIVEDKLEILTSAANFSFDGDADYSNNYSAFSFVQEKYVIPVKGTRPVNPLSGTIEYSFPSYPNAVLASLDSSFYIGSGSLLDLENCDEGNMIYFGNSFISNPGYRTTVTVDSGFFGINMRRPKLVSGFDYAEMNIDVNGTVVSFTNASAFGILGIQDYSSNYYPNSFVQKSWVESNFYSPGSGNLDIGAGKISLSANTPSAYNDGDIWFDGADIKARVGGVTKTFTLT